MVVLPFFFLQGMEGAVVFVGSWVEGAVVFVGSWVEAAWGENQY
jgi:hypothetical protein